MNKTKFDYKNIAKSVKDFIKTNLNTLIYTINIILSLVIIICLAIHYNSKLGYETNLAFPEEFALGKITEILEVSNDEYDIDNTHYFSTITKFKAVVENKVVTGIQTVDNTITVPQIPVELNDKVILRLVEIDEDSSYYTFIDFYRIDYIIILCIAFMLLILLFGGKKGINTLIALILTCLVIFFVFVPSILVGTNIYISSILTCIFITIFTLILISGFSNKSISAMIGCSGGILIAGIISILMITLMNLTGNVDEHSAMIYYLNPNVPIDLNALIFASIILGALGATMDVAMSIASSLSEINVHNNKCTFKELVFSGLNIGKDILGTMSNTLILAYIGSSLCVVVLIASLNNSPYITFNSEMIIIEILNAISGTIGILFTIPLTSLVSSWLITYQKNKEV